ncbi:phospholipase D [Malassezia sp. CBS 17886]|nr:phospholipase D [Malassezia sp. CBS 17886]
MDTAPHAGGDAGDAGGGGPRVAAGTSGGAAKDLPRDVGMESVAPAHGAAAGARRVSVALPSKEASPSADSAAPAASALPPLTRPAGAPPAVDDTATHGSHSGHGHTQRRRLSMREDSLPASARALLQNLLRSRTGSRDKRTAVLPEVNVVDELALGMLQTAMLKMHLERDENGDPRMPVLLHMIQLSITNTVHGSPGSSPMLYRLELSYGDGLLRWVIYREMRDLLALHTYFRSHTVRGALGKSLTLRTAEADQGLPSFPKGALTGRLTTWNYHPSDDEQRHEREDLETYMKRLIRWISFRPEANRLCRFLELSALAVQLAGSGGTLGKQGYVQIKSRASRHVRIHLTRLRGRAPKWCMVRDSYIVFVENMESVQVHDILFMDQGFEVVQARHIHRNVPEYPPPAPGGAADEAPRTGATVHQYVKRHMFNVRCTERRLRLIARSERDMEQFLLSLKWTASHCAYVQAQRFGSFAPVRRHVSAQWLADGRDYYWNLSAAIAGARERIYIHDWWLSPELYLRRPGTLEWRLDYLLQRKAREGVQIYVILYNEVSNQFTPTDSSYAKQRLMGLHPNIFVQRSPSHFQTGTLYWAHHEKLCVVDDMVAYIGGFDLCFGRWDTPAHVLADAAPADAPAPEPPFLGPARDGTELLVWPGQDYANERVVEWHTLHRPEQDVVARETTPRMPWHDVGVQLLGQPARDLVRHFCQRWNMLLRSKKHTRTFPFLLPPAELSHADHTRLGVHGTCEVQICRSAGPWSMSTPRTVEQSVQQAYLKAIQNSEHFVYIENQFFITSTYMDGLVIENRIGLALTERIVRAHREGTPWRAVVVIPLTPGFPAEYDHPESAGVRLIAMLQYLSIARGPNSIYGRLLRAGIDPDMYISFYSLRSWGRLRDGQLTTEQLYIHGKVMVVDDRIAVIGSANINERSQRGDRDSELACVVRDEDTLSSEMGGRPFSVGRFPHTLRMRLMGEHVGVPLDELETRWAASSSGRDGAHPQGADKPSADKPSADTPSADAPSADAPSADTPSADAPSADTPSADAPSADTPSADAPSADTPRATPSASYRHSRHESSLWTLPADPPTVHLDALRDPLSAACDMTWQGSADYNTMLFRRVFQCVPDNDVKTWAAYKHVQHWNTRVARSCWRRAPNGSNVWAGVGERPPLDVFSAQDVDQMERLLLTSRGALVNHPLHFLEQESMASNFLFPMDQINPLVVFA